MHNKNFFYFYNYAQLDIGKQQQQRDKKLCFQLLLDKFWPFITWLKVNWTNKNPKINWEI